MKPTIHFDDADLQHANATWGCSCGPAALAAALGITLDQVRVLVPTFEATGYMNPTMMREAIDNAGRQLQDVRNHWPVGGIARVQFTGPWTTNLDGDSPNLANRRWAYRHTHWIASFTELDDQCWVYDVNGGLQTRDHWEAETVRTIAASIPRADGDWYRTHNWDLVLPSQVYK